MITIGIYNDNTIYESNNNIKYIKYKGDIKLMNKYNKSSSKMEKYSLTNITDSLDSLNIIKKYVNNESLLIDGTTSIGGDFIHFIKYFKYNIGIEINKDRFNKLNNNISKIDNINLIENKHNVYKYKYFDNKITTINTSFLNIYEKLINTNKYIKHICFYIDPPWGGKEYKLYNYVILGLDNNSLINIIKNIKKYENNDLKIDIFLKLPRNLYLDIFKDFKYNKYTINKFILIHIKTE
jgi:hypothetical protein